MLRHSLDSLKTILDSCKNICIIRGAAFEFIRLIRVQSLDRIGLFRRQRSEGGLRRPGLLKRSIVELYSDSCFKDRFKFNRLL